MSNWHESIPGQIQQFKAQEAQRKLAKLAEEQAELQRQKAAAEAQQKNRAQPDFQEKQVATERRLTDLTEQVAQLTKALTESRGEHVAARPHIPEGKGGPCVTCGTPISFNAQMCLACSEPDAGRKVREKAEEEEAAAREAEARRRQEEEARIIASL